MAVSTAQRLKRSHLGSAPNGRCCHCARLFDRDRLSLDHILPRSLGGKLTKKNTAIACKPCNVERGTEDFWSFRQRKRSEVLGYETDLSSAYPTREEWARLHATPEPRPNPPRPGKKAPPKAKPTVEHGWTQEKDDAWWLKYREPTPRDPL